jgi:peptidoglycan/xylan/chitin deacetylase (PgdA/CDA1 family)
MPAPTLPHRIVSKVTRLVAPHIPLVAYRRMIPRSPVGFFYHIVSNESLPHIKHLYPYKSSSEFEQDILWLKRHFTVIGYPELLANACGQRSLKENSAFVSFDDGFAAVHTFAQPVLLKHDVPSILFLATDWVGNQAMFYRSKISLCIAQLEQLDTTRQESALGLISHVLQQELKNRKPDFRSVILDLRSLQQTDEQKINQVCEILGINISSYLRTHKPFLTREQVTEMQDEGFVFGAHTRSHPKLSLLSQDQQAEEIIESCRIVCEWAGQDQVPFAFPFSGDGVDRTFLAHLRRENPHIGLIFDTKKLKRETDICHRIWVDKPVPGISSEKNLSHWLHDAYVRELSE